MSSWIVQYVFFADEYELSKNNDPFAENDDCPVKRVMQWLLVQWYFAEKIGKYRGQLAPTIP